MADYCFDDKFLAVTLRELFIYSIFYASLLFVTLYKHDCMTFEHNNTIRKALEIQLKSHTVSFNFYTISNVEQIWQFLNLWLNKEILLNVNMYNKFRCGKEIEREPIFLGSPRLSQVRAQSTECPMPPAMNAVFNNCYGLWTKATEETKPFGLKEKPGWVYAPDLDLDNRGSITWYSGGGYSIHLRDEEDFKNLYLAKSTKSSNHSNESPPCDEGDEEIYGPVDKSKLKPGSWIDEQTRAVFLEYNTYSPSTNFFTFVALTFEIPPTGNVITNAEIWTLQLFRTTSVLDFMILALQVFLFMMLIFYAMERYKEISYFGTRYFCSFWGIIECLLLLSGLVFFLVSLLQSRIIKNRLSVLIDSVCRGDFWPSMNLHSLKWWLVALNVAHAIFIFFATIKLMKFLMIFESYSRLIYLLKRVFCSISVLMFAFNMIIISFGYVGHLLFCQTSAAFRSLCQSIITAYAMLVGALDYSTLFDPCSYTAHMYIFSYYILIIMFGTNFFRSVTVQAYADAICNYKSFCKERCRIACAFPFANKLKELCKAPPCSNRICDQFGDPIDPELRPECGMDYVPDGHYPQCNRPCRICRH